MPMNDVVVLLPGIMGSVLERDGAPVWDVGTGALGRALLTGGGSIRGLALDAAAGGGPVRATRLLDGVHLVPHFWKIDGYGALAAWLVKRLALTPGESFFTFPYDWRQDNRASARALAEATAGWLDAQRRRAPQARLVLIAHSMGGLVARHFVEVLGGWRHTRLLVTLGTPHRGAVKALDFLANGLRARLGPLTLADLSPLVRSFPSAYQLLPIYPCLGHRADTLLRLEDWPGAALGELDLARARDGIAFHREIEAAETVNRRDPAYAVRLLPFVGTEQPTMLSALATDDGVQPLRTWKGQELLLGDGTVPRVSATPVSLSGAGTEAFVACAHSGLQNFDPLRVHLRAVLQDVDILEFKAAPAGALALDLPDAVAAGGGAVVRARCRGALLATDALRADLAAADASAAAQTLAFAPPAPGDTEGWATLTLPPLAPGVWRLTLRAEGDDAPEPVQDLFLAA
jgi:hypothetical protein